MTAGQHRRPAVRSARIPAELEARIDRARTEVHAFRAEYDAWLNSPDDDARIDLHAWALRLEAELNAIGDAIDALRAAS